MEDLKNAVMKALLYFDIFSFPLLPEEVHRFCGVEAGPGEVEAALRELVLEEQAWEYQGCFMARQKEEWVTKRKRNFKISQGMMRTARRNASLISQFPFVRGVALSGSLSKYSADERADIDYFIIARPGRLWICRSLLHIFKKLTFLFGKQHDFCMNYFLDEDELELKDKNYYTALESITIIPLYGAAAQQAFFEANGWVRAFFPNYDPRGKLSRPLEEGHSGLKRILELAFSGLWGNALDTALRRFSVWWWRHKFRINGFPMQYFNQDLRATRGESKYHPNDYQRLILAAFSQRIHAHEEKFGYLERDR